MHAGPTLTVPDARDELPELRPDDPETEPVPDAGEVVDVQRLVALHLLVGRAAVVLPLQPGEDPHVERLVQPGPAVAADPHLVAAVRGQALPHSTGSGLAAVRGLTAPASHCPGGDTPPPHLEPSAAGLGAGGPASPQPPLTGGGAGGRLAGSPLRQLLAGPHLSSLPPPPPHLLANSTAG